MKLNTSPVSLSFRFWNRVLLIYLIVPLAWILIFLSNYSSACQVCVALPKKTLADKLLEAEQVILARENPEQPFHFITTEILKGSEINSPIDAFLNSHHKRQLKKYPEHAILLVKKQGSKEWVPIGITNKEFSRVVRRIISLSDDWKPMETNNRQRVFEFSQYLKSEDGRLRELAYLEIARAPYGLIKNVSASVPLPLAREVLDDSFYYEWQRLAILLLGFSNESADKARIKERIEMAHKYIFTKHLDAWLIAYIEVGRKNAIEQITTFYIKRRARKSDELIDVLAALTVQGNDKPALRDEIITAYGELLKYYPELAVKIIHNLISWQRWELTEELKAIRVSMGKKQPLSSYQLDRYLRMAAAKNR